MHTLRVRVSSADEVGRVVADVVAAVAVRAGLAGGRAYWLRLAADEITTNAMTHGYRGRAGVIDIEAGVTPEGAWLTIADDAPAFDPREHDAGPALTGPPVVGGYGIFLALNSIDEFDYERTGGRNRYTLRIRLDTPPAAECGEETSR